MTSGAPAPAPVPTSPARKSGFSLPLALGALGVVLGLIALAAAFAVPGPAGPSGSSSGTPNVTYWAVVDSGGGLARGYQVNSTTLTATGEYTVTFLPFLDGCTFGANLATTSAGTQPGGWATVTADAANPHAVDVATYNASGPLTDYSFHVAASCPGGLSAVVAADGTFVSGAGVISSGNFGGTSPGTYNVIFDQDVSSCAYIGGPGSGSGQSVAGAGSVTFASLAANSYGVWVDTHAANGTLENQTFHLAVYC